MKEVNQNVNYLINFLIIVFYVSIFLISINIYKDYNIYSDETFHRWVGELYYLHIKEFFLTSNFNNIYLDEININLNNEGFRVWFIYPVFFDIICEFINDIFEIKKLDKIYQTRHLINFLIFFISSIYLYIIILKRFDHIFYSLIAVSFYFFSPRIFGNIFFNSKDILFLSFIVISSYYGFILLKEKSFRNFFIFSLIAGLSINIRIMGIFLPLAIYLIIIFENLNIKKELYKDLKNILFSFLIIFLVVFIFWPYLWSSPLINFFHYLKWLLKEIYVIDNFYLGENFKSNYVPWHYLLVWISITLPASVIIISLKGFVYNFFYFFSKILNFSEEQNLWKNNNEKFDLYCFVVLFLIIIFSFSSSNFGGWRHFYFLFFYIIYFFIFTLAYLNSIKSKLYYKILIIFVLLDLITKIFWIINNHPHQYVYFNNIKKYFVNRSFDLDYFGLSEKAALEYILKYDKRSNIKVYSYGYSWLKGSVTILGDIESKRVTVTSINDSDYVIDRNVPFHENKLIDENIFIKYYEIKVDDNIINIIYKKKQ